MTQRQARQIAVEDLPEAWQPCGCPSCDAMRKLGVLTVMGAHAKIRADQQAATVLEDLFRHIVVGDRQPPEREAIEASVDRLEYYVQHHQKLYRWLTTSVAMVGAFPGEDD